MTQEFEIELEIDGDRVVASGQYDHSDPACTWTVIDKIVIGFGYEYRFFDERTQGRRPEFMRRFEHKVWKGVVEAING